MGGDEIRLELGFGVGQGAAYYLLDLSFMQVYARTKSGHILRLIF
jgi:hypothetical protein